MAISKQLQNAIDRASAAIAAANPDQVDADWNRSLASYCTILPAATGYYHQKLDWLVNGGGPSIVITLPAWGVSTVDVALFKTTWGV